MASLERIHRLLRLVELLQSGRLHNSRQMADVCGVSRRTIFRDLAILQESGLPLQYDEDREGYAIPASTFLPPTELTLEETLALVVLCHELGENEHGVPFNRSARVAAVKLLSNLPPHLREYVGEVTNSISVRLDPHNPLENSQGTYELLLRAMKDRRPVRIQYDSLAEGKNIQTLLSPYRVLFSRRSWYAIGRSSIHRTIRTFNLGRIHNAEMLDQNYKIPARFSLDRYLGNAWHLIRDTRNRSRVVVRFNKKVAQNVAEVHWHKAQTISWNDDGTIDYQVDVDGLGEIIWWILGYGDQAEVIQPKELREMVRSHIENMRAIYDGPQRATTTRTRRAKLAE